MKRPLTLVSLLLGSILLSACGKSDFKDIDDWMANESKDYRARIEPVPELKPYVPFDYQAQDQLEPFSSAKIQAKKGAGNGTPANWKKEPLEEFDLDKITMVGTLNNKAEGRIALVKVSTGEIFRVKVSNHIGRNFGVITAITDSSVEIKEMIEDSSGDWSERSASLKLSEQE
ncbi:pilus assembly protein PilP [Leeia aquatica]|uniref:Pilus assembly protein PilP n=1 Tax=Leeia aquatica TaxID=2725557 RepID=A0A847SC48_9NEIS|nr:pilus assembly protein PilP [Leeia aquatica]NLR75076.1 pilus assembly protein PilP [Leeia aquatica]